MSDLIKKVSTLIINIGENINFGWRADTTIITADQTGPTADGAQ